MIHNLSTITHAYGPETQSRWNGMMGNLTLEAADPVSLRSVAVFPAADRRSAASRSPTGERRHQVQSPAR